MHALPRDVSVTLRFPFATGGQPLQTLQRRKPRFHNSGRLSGSSRRTFPLVASGGPLSGGEPTFINLGEKHPNQPLTTLIWGENRARWPQPPEVRYGGETICVTGEADLHEGTPQIVVSSPKQIQVR